MIDKPAGRTSHDVVAQVKRKLGAKKVGHLGTLDPLATGLLLLVINKATKAAPLLEGGKKDYMATVRLGEETDTYDSEGTVTATGELRGLTRERVMEAFESFKGKILQVPPMYSSVKKGGKPLYKLARKGIVIERSAREVEVYRIEPLNMEFPEVEFRVVCSRGTYVRTICHDLGRVLGCGAHMTGLRRIGSGCFTIEEAIKPDEDAEVLAGRIIPLEEALRRSGQCAEYGPVPEG